MMGLAPTGETRPPFANGMAPPQDAGMQEETPNVSPEMQAQYDEFVENAREILYPNDGTGQVSPAILESLAGRYAPDIAALFQVADPPITASPADAVAVTTVALVMMLDASSTQAGVPVDDAVVLHGGREILEDMIELAEASSGKTFEQQAAESAMFRAVDLFRVASPRVDPAALAQQFEEIRAAEADGTLAQKVPHLAPVLAGVEAMSKKGAPR